MDDDGLISSSGSIFSRTAGFVCSLLIRDDEALAVCEIISDVLDKRSAVSYNVSDISCVEAFDKFFSEIAFFKVAAVLFRVSENFSAVSFKVC